MIYLKSYEEVEIMRQAGKILGGLLDDVILCKIKDGISTKDIDQKVEEYINDNGALPILKGYGVDDKDYPYASCISLNEEVVHGIPSDRKLKSGDLISVDVSLSLQGYCVDAARTYKVGEVSKEAEDLIRITEESFYDGLKKFIVGNRIGDVSHAVQKKVESNGYSVIKDFCGHGIGQSLHEDPQVLNYGSAGLGSLIEPGLTIALEPMVSLSSEWTRIKEDGWTAVTRDGSISAHYENTVVALEDGPEILTAKE